MTGDPPVVVMGVSASGKSTLAEALATERGAEYVDADDLHPEANVRKMSAGMPLDDADRMPWLDVVGARLARPGGNVVIACSALKRSYRDRLRAEAPDAVFVHLHGDREALLLRAAQRPGHFMPAALLDSQIATLEALQPDEGGLVVDIGMPVADAVERIESWLGARYARSSLHASSLPVNGRLVRSGSADPL
ncbi:gluconokinase [Microbacterium sp. AK031]|uniref:gluconokinase n=1 Tax=Microbacterium sp. AK031 TaxID=2723076 RepID=UPI002169D0ED|nr:gluconokinase [Microbacterium sp. AK031]MCS3843833.1 gluconokinase [Microbacterium sp. AK031]